MAEYANSTLAPVAVRPLQIGPVTQAIRNIRGHNADPIEAIRAGLLDYFAGIGILVNFDAPLPDLSEVA